MLRTRIALMLGLALALASACKRERDAPETAPEIAVEAKPCREDETREGTTPCGLQGAREQVCRAGAWVEGSTCVEPWLTLRDGPERPHEDNGSAPISASGETVVVKAECELLVFVREDRVWSQQAAIAVPGGCSHFSPSHALDGDSLAISGKDFVYMFERSGGTWQQRDTLSFASESVGRSLALSHDTLVIGGSPADDGGGAAHVLVRRDGTWQPQATLESIDEHARFFGEAVAIDDDTALIGVAWDSEKDTFAGAAMVFVRRGESWEPQAKLLGSDSQRADHFGGAVALAGDIAVVGASESQAAGYSTGSAYVFERRAGEWTETARLSAPKPTQDAKFGRVVAVHRNTIIVGAPGTAGGTAASVYLYFGSEGRWPEPIQTTPVLGAGADVALADGVIAVAGWSVTVVLDPRAL